MGSNPTPQLDARRRSALCADALYVPRPFYQLETLDLHLARDAAAAPSLRSGREDAVLRHSVTELQLVPWRCASQGRTAGPAHLGPRGVASVELARLAGGKHADSARPQKNLQEISQCKGWPAQALTHSLASVTRTRARGAPSDQRVDEGAEGLVLGLPAEGGARGGTVDDLTWWWRVAVVSSSSQYRPY